MPFTPQVSFQTFPSNKPPPQFINLLVDVFFEHHSEIQSTDFGKSMVSDEVLRTIEPSLAKQGFEVESGKRKDQKIDVPVFYGRNGKPSLRFQVDAYNSHFRCGLEVEAGRSVNGGNAIYRDIYQALVMDRIDHMAIAVPHLYRSNDSLSNGKGEDCYTKCVEISQTLFMAERISIPFGLTIIGY